MISRKLLLLLASLVLALVAQAGLSAQPAIAADDTADVATVSHTVQQRDANCTDFGSQAAAQQYFLNNGGPDNDPDGLDSDGDGVACESNPCPCSTSQGGGGGGQPPAPPAPPVQRADFGTIALNLKGRSGTSKDYSTRSGAVRQAVRVCNQKATPRFRCIEIGSVKNGCAAVWFSLDSRGNVVTKGARKAKFTAAPRLAKASRAARDGRRGGRVVGTCA